MKKVLLVILLVFSITTVFAESLSLRDLNEIERDATIDNLREMAFAVQSMRVAIYDCTSSTNSVIVSGYKINLTLSQLESVKNDAQTRYVMAYKKINDLILRLPKYEDK